MIAWSIEATRNAELFDHIIVSTDDHEIAEVATQYGAEVPFERPSELSDDFTGTTDVVAHTIRWAQKNEWSISAVCCVYATAPFIQTSDLKKALAVFETGNWEYVFPACEFAAPIFRAFQQDEKGRVEMFYPEHFLTRSQDLPMAFHDVGQFYWGRTDAWLNAKVIFDKHSFALPIPRWRVQDIDVPDDWRRAEIMHRTIFKKG